MRDVDLRDEVVLHLNQDRKAGREFEGRTWAQTPTTEREVRR